MSCSLLNNIKSACSYNPGGITGIRLLDICQFISCRFRDDKLYTESYIQKIYVSDDTVFELQAAAETAFTETKSGDIYKQELKTFVSTLDADTLSSLLIANANKYLVMFRNSQGKHFCFGSDGGASLSFSQLSGKEGEASGYNITISKESIHPLFEVCEQPFYFFPSYVPDFDQFAVCETYDDIEPDPFIRGSERQVHIWIANDYNSHGYGFRSYDFDLMRSRSFDTGFQGTYRTISVGEHEWTKENLKALHHFRGSVDFRWHDWTDDNIAAITASYNTRPFEKPLSVDEFLRLNGTWFTAAVPGLLSYREPAECKFRQSATGQIINGWDLPDIQDIYQLIGQAPRLTGSVLSDVLNFVGASVSDVPVGYSSTWFDNQNISGLTLTPLGARLSEQGTQHLADNVQDFKQRVSLRLKGFEQEFIFKLTALEYYSYNSYTYGQVRYCRHKSNEELGYKLVIDSANDKVLMLDSSEVNLLPELPTGMRRGVALRYMNRELRSILKPWSAIEAEAEEIELQITKY